MPHPDCVADLFDDCPRCPGDTHWEAVLVIDSDLL